MKESKQDIIQLHNVPHDILQQLVDSMYSFEITVDAGNALLLLQAADMLEMEQIVEACKAFLKASIDSINCLTIYHGAQQLSFNDLAEECLAFALEHFKCVSSSEGFLCLDAIEVMQLIGSDRLNVEKEEHVAAAVVRWLDYAPKTRLPHVAEMARHPRTGMLMADYLASLPDTSTSRHLRQAILPVLAGDSAPTPGSSYDDTSGKCKAGIACLDPLTSRSWSFPCPSQFIYRTSAATYTVKNDRLLVYLIGWTGDVGTFNHQLQVYDADLDQWANVAALPKYSYGKPVVIGDQVYALIDGLVYVYKEEKQRMTARSRMPQFFLGSAVAVCEGRLYVFGGLRSERDRFSSAITTAASYCYDPARNVWEELAPMPTARADCSACVGPDGLIYVAGGYTGVPHWNSAIARVEAYDVRMNQWLTKHDMQCARMELGLVLLNNTLYAVGGCRPGGKKGSPAMESYDTATDRWTGCGAPAFHSAQWCGYGCKAGCKAERQLVPCGRFLGVMPRQIIEKMLQRCDAAGAASG
ncbi:kelch-like protein 3 [Paramacrobiotus metropolitanus]|uniref:kelch-like protein 3 n=1 Tax=Paramacrobiotus metropolitanus TaxID=2943436 RepID=UPI002445E8B7|nr:kelch-like protein 3 [Paramacrobiotus metropolitanus]